MPLSDDPRKRERQLANLTGRPPAPPDRNQRARRHGGYATVVVSRLDVKVRELFDALSADAPLRDGEGHLPAADTVAVRLAAECLCRLEDVGASIRDHGLVDAKGNLRPVVDLERRLRQEAADYLDAMGMTPRSRAKLGLDLTRSATLAELMAQDAELERRERAGDVIEGEVTDA